MTIGIVWVACLAARIEERSKDKDIDLELHEFSHLAWNLIQLSLTVAIINQNVFALNITEIAQSLSECISEHMGIGGGGADPFAPKIRLAEFSSAAAPEGEFSSILVVQVNPRS